MIQTLTLTLVVGCAACSKQDGPPPIVAPSDPTVPPVPTPPPSAAPTTATTKLPPLDDSCTKASDCDISHRDSSCCFVCGGTYGNKKWVADVEAYCAGPGANAKCPPVHACERETTSPALGYVMATPKCTAGHCSDK